MTTIKQTYETVPFNGLFLDAHAVKSLGLSCQPVTNEDIDKIPQTYPAYTALIDTLTKQSMRSGFDELIDCLYSNPENLLNSYQQPSITNFDNFYFCAHQFLYDFIAGALVGRTSRNDTTYNIIHLFEWMRNKEKISCKDMCQKILNCKPAETLTTWWHYGNMSCANTPYGKNKIAMLYTLVEEYNNDRKNKKTPTGKQYIVYNQKKMIDIVLPDNFDATLFDKKIYAFTAFRKLKHGIEILTNTSSHNLQKMVELKMEQL